MKSTGEVMGIDSNFDIAFAKSQLGGGVDLPEGGTVFVSVKDSDKDAYRPGGGEAGRAWLHASSPPAAPPRISRRRACRSSGSTRSRRGGRTSSTGSSTARSQLVFNTTEGWQSLKDSQSIRATALKRKVPYFTTAAASLADGAGDRGAARPCA